MKEVTLKVLERGLNNFESGHFDEALQECRCCFRFHEAGAPVPPEGDKSNVQWLIQGAAPGRHEVKDTIPFSPKGQGGHMLAGYMDALGISRDDCYLTNTCFCMGLRDRLPTITESQICARWKAHEYGSIPYIRYIVLLGNNAVRQILGYTQQSVVYSNGKTYKSMIGKRYVYILTVHHPGYLLRNPSKKQETVEALVNFRQEVVNGLLL